MKTITIQYDASALPFIEPCDEVIIQYNHGYFLTVDRSKRAFPFIFGKKDKKGKLIPLPVLYKKITIDNFK